MNYVDGDLIKLAQSGSFDVIVHGCNCLSRMASGLAPQMAAAFGCDKYKMELQGPNINKLGNIDYITITLDNGNELNVVNAYTQYSFSTFQNTTPFDYEAFTVICRKLNTIFNGKHIGMPLIGAGLAGGDWNVIEKIIQKEIVNCKITIVNYKP